MGGSYQVNKNHVIRNYPSVSNGTQILNILHKICQVNVF